jgi:hypothetical protein
MYMLKTLIGAAAIVAAVPSMATTYSVPLTNVGPGNDAGSLTVSPGAGNFLDLFQFGVPRSGRGTVTVTSIQDPLNPNATNVNFNATNVKFNGVKVPRISAGVFELRMLMTAFTGAGISNLVVQGASGSLGSYTSSLSIVVPETATWGMLIVGFGGVGVALRTRRRRTSVAATA